MTLTLTLTLTLTPTPTPTLTLTRYVLEKLQGPLLAIFKQAVADLPLATADAAASKTLL